MIIAKNYKGCRIFIHDENGSEIAHTTITEYDSDYMRATIPCVLNIENTEFVSVLIITNEGIHEYLGKILKPLFNSLSSQIALFKGQLKKEVRNAKRYSINTTAQIQSLVIRSNPAPLLNPLNVSILNLSSSGSLIRATPDCFRMNSVLEMKLSLGSNLTTIYGQIVRINNVDQTVTDYGCKFGKFMVVN